MAAAIHARKLGKTYRTGFWMRAVVGLTGLDLDVEAGETFGFIGPNGAGKTTTIKILTGLHRATEGEASVLGRSVGDPRSRERLGFLPERPYFYEHLTARELLDFYGRLQGLPGARRRARIGELLPRVGLERFADVALRSYSKGMLQRVGLCQALLHEPELVILDEPMSGLDPLGRALVADLIRAERARGCTVFFSSHILSDVEVLCDRVAIVVGGQVRAQGPVHSLVDAASFSSEITVGGLLAEDLPRAPLRSEPGALVIRVEAEEVDPTLDRLRALGGRILRVHPIRPTLEEVFLSEVERAQPVQADRPGLWS